MKISIKKSKETIEYRLEDATVQDCIDLVKALNNLEEKTKPCEVYHVPVPFLTASGLELDKWGDLYNLKRGFLETDDAYRQRFVNRIMGHG